MIFLVDNTWYKYWMEGIIGIAFLLFLGLFIVIVVDIIIKKRAKKKLDAFISAIKLNRYDMSKQEIKDNLKDFKIYKETKLRLTYRIRKSLYKYDEYVAVFSLENKAIDLHYTKN